MKKIILTFFFLVSSVVLAQAPDILIATDLRPEWSHLFTRQFRQFLQNINVNDPLKTTLKGDTVIYNGDLAGFSGISGKTKSFLSYVTGLNLDQSPVKIIIKDLSFEFKDLKASLEQKSVLTNQNILWKGDFNGRGIRVWGKEILVELHLFSKLNLPPIKLKVLDPAVKVDNLNALKFYTDLSFMNQNKKTSVNFFSADFKRTINWLQDNPRQVHLKAGRIISSNISINILGKKINLSQKQLEEFLKSRFERLKELLLKVIIKNLKQGMGLSLLKNIEKVRYQNNQWVETDHLAFSWNLMNIKSLNGKNIVQMDFASEFCLSKDFVKKERLCRKNYASPPKFSYDKDTFLESKALIADMLAREEGNLVFSLSEFYLNSLLQKTIDGGYWQEALEENLLRLGPAGVFTRLNNDQEIAVYIDMIYLAKKGVKRLLGTEEVRFPVKILMDFLIQNRGGKPVFVIRIKDFDITIESLTQGFKELGLESSLLEQKRFRRMTAKKILKQLEPYVNTDAYVIEMPVMKDLGLEEVKFRSDGFGRINAFMKYQTSEQ